ncbi:MAG: hypothetical protein ACO3UU_11720 [Minisyncoccia bacterium]
MIIEYASDIISTFDHPEVGDLRIEASLWFNANNCRPDDVVIPVTNKVEILVATLRHKSGVRLLNILT